MGEGLGDGDGPTPFGLIAQKCTKRRVSLAIAYKAMDPTSTAKSAQPSLLSSQLTVGVGIVLTQAYFPLRVCTSGYIFQEQ